MIVRRQNALGESFATNEKIQAVLLEVLTHLARVEPDKAPKTPEEVLKDLEQFGLQVVKRKSANNKIFEISYKQNPGEPPAPDDKVIIQIVSHVIEGDTALQHIINHRQGLDWFVDIYHSLRIPSAELPETVYVTVMEYCHDTLKRRIKSLRNDHDYEKRFDLAVSIMRDLVQILDVIASRGLIWSDLKPGNILLREDGHVVVADSKGIIDPKALTRRVRDQTYILRDVTRGFLSEDFLQHKHTKLKTEDQLQDAFAKEHSYQLAVLLHMMAAAGKPRVTGFDITEVTAFDFSHDIFKTEKGQRLQFIISSLGKHDPKRRMDYHVAVRLLGVLDHAERFEEELRIAEEQEEAARSEAKRSQMQVTRHMSSADVGAFRSASAPLVSEKSPKSSGEGAGVPRANRGLKKMVHSIKSIPTALSGSAPKAERKSRPAITSSSDVFKPEPPKPLAKSATEEREKAVTPRRRGGSNKG